MYAYLLPLHSALRWAVVAGLLWCLLRGILGTIGQARFTKADNFFRSFTSGASHAQLLIGLALYIQSPVVLAFREDLRTGLREPGLWFFGILHIACMIAAVVFITIGTAKARRASADAAKHHALLLWCGAAAMLIFAAVPWPGHPLAARPLLRAF